MYVMVWLDDTVPPTALANNVSVIVLITFVHPAFAVAVNVM